MTFQPSSYQQAIAEAITNGRGNLQVGAVAGSGKTTTLSQIIAPRIKGSCCFLAFNKSIAEELGAKLPKGIQARTIHSLGFGAVKSKFKSTTVDNGKYRNLVKGFLGDLPDCPKAVVESIDNGQADLFGPMVKMLDLCRNTLTDATDSDAVEDLAAHYSVDLPDNGALAYFLQSLPRILRVGRELACQVVDFSDMLWLTATDNTMRPKTYDWLLVDECQDLSKAQLAVVKKALKRGGRCVFVGDERQAINGFAGADCDAFENIHLEMDTTILPLSICYRCPSSHVALAQGIVSQIEARKDAPKGTIESIERSKLESALVEGDMVLCRVNSALIDLCFSLIAEGKPARIKGRDIGEGLITAAKKIAKRRDFAGWDKFGESVDAWSRREVAKLLKRNGGNEEDARIESLSDRAHCLTIIWARSEAQNGRDFIAAVEDIFSNDRPGIQLSSVHRAKGLEADSIFILRPDLLPGPWAAPGSWQFTQEMNLKYVALTRSMDKLTFVTGD